MKIAWSRRAIRHLTALRDYIAHDSPENAANIAALIIQSVELLTSQPAMGRPGRLVGTRELVVPRTPFVIPYRVRSGELQILAVFHGRRRRPKRL